MMPNQDPKDDAFDPRLFTTWAEALKPITPPPALRARLMARVRAEMGDEGLRTIRAGEGWVEFMPGIEFKMLYRDETTGARSLLARLDPGVAMPAHDHGFPEECLLLQGEITIGDITVCAGDYHFAAKGARHETLSIRTGALLFLRAGRESRSPSSRVEASVPLGPKIDNNYN